PSLPITPSSTSHEPGLKYFHTMRRSSSICDCTTARSAPLGLMTLPTRYLSAVVLSYARRVKWRLRFSIPECFWTASTHDSCGFCEKWHHVEPALHESS